MIRWNKRISVKKDPNDNVYILTDRGQRWDTFAINKTNKNITPITEWWDANHKSELREWQKDAIVRELSSIFGSGNYFVVYQKNKGTHQTHDICLANWKDIWVLSTENDLWLWRTNYGEYHLDATTSFGSIMNKGSRFEWYKVIEGLKEMEKI